MNTFVPEACLSTQAQRQLVLPPLTQACGLFSPWQDKNFELWERPLSDRAYAVAVLNQQEIGGPQNFTFSLTFLGNGLACNPACCIQQILPTSRDWGVHNWVSSLSVEVNPTGTVLLKVVPL